MSKKRKRNKRHRGKSKYNKKKHGKKNKIQKKNEKHKHSEHKKKQSAHDHGDLIEDFRARRRKQDIIFIAVMILIGIGILSAYYFYCLLLAVSIFVFIITFYNKAVLLNIALLFTCSYSAIMGNTQVLLETVTNARFYPILTIMPALYLALLIIDGKRESK